MEKKKKNKASGYCKFKIKKELGFVFTPFQVDSRPD